MTTDDFAEAARAEAQRAHFPAAQHRTPTAVNRATSAAFLDGATWARDHLAVQEPTDAEVEALCRAVDEQAGYWLGPITASMVLQDARRAARKARP